MRPPFLERYPPKMLTIVGGLLAVIASLAIAHFSIWVTGTVPMSWLQINVVTILCPALIAPPMIFWHAQAIQQIALQRRELAATNEKLAAALAEVRELSGLLPVCAWCSSVRDDQGYWNKVDAFIARNTRAKVTHSICPKCSAKEFAHLCDPTAS